MNTSAAPANGPIEVARARLAEGQFDLAHVEIRNAVARQALDSAAVLRAGRTLRKSATRIPDTTATPRVLLAGQCTTSWLADALVCWTTDPGPVASVTEAAYDNVLQAIRSLPHIEGSLGILLPWNERLLGGALDESTDRVQAELDFWKQVWNAAAHRGMRIIQVGYDCVDPGPAGILLPPQVGGHLGRIRSINQRLREELPDGAVFVDLEWIAGDIGRTHFYDSRQYWWTRNPFSEAGCVQLAKHLRAAMNAVDRGPRKVLAIDLDNTIWGGVVGETGPLEIDLGGSPAGLAYQDFQRVLLALVQRGCLLVALSKNTAADARSPFDSNPEMVLRLEDFAAFEAGWESKSIALRRVAEHLGIGLDAFAFFDDEPAERELMRVALPEVAVIDVPADPCEFRRALLNSLVFESAVLTAEDRTRTQLYREQASRVAASTSIASEDDYLDSLKLRGSVEPIGDGNIERVAQLIAKTNQFNLTNRRHGREAILALARKPGAIGLAIRVSDRFGDYGLVCAIIATPSTGDPSSLEIDSWVMSCRVIARTVDAFAFNALLDAAMALGSRRLIGRYSPTPRNELTAGLYSALGFSSDAPYAALGDQGDVADSAFVLDITDAQHAKCFVQAELGTRATR